MAPDLFSYLYPAGLILWTVVGFCVTKMIYEAKASSRERGLSTTHPELIDENGELVNEDLYAVRFGISGHTDHCPDHQSFGKVPFALYRTRLIQKPRNKSTKIL